MEKLIYGGRLIRLYSKKTVLPNGNPVNLELIHHPGAALILPFLSAERAVILKQYRPAVKKYLYELPAGTIDHSENPLECARREIVEETGFNAKKFTRLGVIYPVPGYSTEKIFIYKAEKLFREKAGCEKDEVISVRVVTKAQVKEMLKAGKLTDAKTISAFCLCGWL